MNQRVVCLCHSLSPGVALCCSNSQCIIFVPLAWTVSGWLSGSVLIGLLFWKMAHLGVKLS